MALNLNLGFGDNEYQDNAENARRKAAAGDGPSLIASLLDAIGVHKQVAKGGESGAAKKDKKDKQGVDAAPAAVVPTGESDVLAAAESALVTPSAAANPLPPSQRPTTDWGKQMADKLLLRPLGQRQIDPDLGARGVLKPIIPF